MKDDEDFHTIRANLVHHTVTLDDQLPNLGKPEARNFPTEEGHRTQFVGATGNLIKDAMGAARRSRMQV